ncbi:MAG TPA: fibronectin type III domain-containing protein [Gemmatimonadales bacterium]|jgi:hypothetical protein
MWLRRYHLAWPVLALSLIACERTQPVEPVFEASATAGSGAGVKAPSNIGAIAGSFSQISLSWQDNSSNEDGFEVQRATPWPSSPYTLRDNLPTNTIAFGDTGLTASTQYCYRVRAYQTKGRQTDFSAFSAAVCVTTQAPPPPPTPSAPSNVSAALVPGITVRVQWADNSSNEIGFRLERSADQVTWATVATIGPSSDASVSFIDDTWSIEQQACYRVFAFNAAGDSPSASACTAPLLGPTNLTLTDGLAWTDNSSIEDGYEVWVRFGPYCSILPTALLAVLPADAASAPGAASGECPIVGYLVAATKAGAYSDWAEVAAMP